MDQFLLQIVPAGPGDDAEGWMNILFVIVLAVFWVISGIIKATAKKPQDGRNVQPSQKSIRRVPKQTKAREPSFRRLVIPAHARAKKLRDELELGPSVPKPYLGPVLEELPEDSSQPLKKGEQIDVAVPQQSPKAKELPELVLDYMNPDELSRAILHYEILGPPVSLRDPSHVAGF